MDAHISAASDNRLAISLALALKELSVPHTVAFVESPWVYKAWCEYPYDRICEQPHAMVVDQAISIFNQAKAINILNWDLPLPVAEPPHWPNNMANVDLSPANHLADFMLKCHAFVTRHALGKALINGDEVAEKTLIKLFLGTQEALARDSMNDWDTATLVEECSTTTANEEQLFAIRLRNWKERHFVDASESQLIFHKDTAYWQNRLRDPRQSEAYAAEIKHFEEFLEPIGVAPLKPQKLRSPLFRQWQQFDGLHNWTTSSLVERSFAIGASTIVHFPPIKTMDCSTCLELSEKEHWKLSVVQEHREDTTECSECGRPGGLHGPWCPYYNAECPSLGISWWGEGDKDWHHEQTFLHKTSDEASTCPEKLFPQDFSVGIIKAQAHRVSRCEMCRRYFTKEFAMPRLWWAGYCKNSNGHLGFEETRDEKGAITALSTWTLFKTKHLRDDSLNYEWYRMNLFIRWISESNRTILIMFDTPQPVVDSLQNLLLQEMTIAKFSDPLWIYPVIVEEAVRLQDDAVWTIRDQVRNLEKHRAPLENPKPNFENLHEISRHAIHVSETLDLHTKSIRMIITRHEKLSQQGQAGPSANNTHDTLLFYEQMLTSLRARSASNKERLVNEIQLAFNTVAQYDSRLSLKIGHAAQVDSKAMKTIAFVTLTFLPATFISAVFSMSFFDYDLDSGVWAVSDKFWLYWVVVIPITGLTFLCWHLWWRQFPSEPPGTAQEVDSEVDLQKSLSYRRLRRFLTSRNNTEVV